MGEGDKIVCVTRMDGPVAHHAFRLTEAMPKIVAAHPNARLILIGGGDVLDDLTALAEKTDAQLGGGHIFVLGPRSDIAKILPHADVFVGVSRAAMEAMACRKPVVLTGAQGHLGVYTPDLEEEAISTNFCCRTRPAADADTIADGVIDILNRSDEERRQMGEYNRDVIRRCYSVSRMAKDALDMYERTVREHVFRRPRVLISGYYGSGNTGDDALLSAIVEGLHKRGIDQVAALCGNAPLPVPGVKRIPRFAFGRVLRAIRKSDLLISGGGSLLQDATSTKSLMYYTWVIEEAKRAGVPVMIYANGIGPIEKEKNIQRAARAIAGAEYISVREEASRDMLTAMGIPGDRIFVTADPVLLSAPAVSRQRGDYVVISLRETAGNMTKTVDSMSMEEAVFRAVKEISHKYGFSAVFLPMQPSYDSEICARAAERLREAGVNALVVEDFKTEELREILGGARVVIGMRLHSLIFAATEGVPSLALAYDPKVSAFMEYLGLGEWALPAFHANDRIVLAKLEEILAREEEIRGNLTRRVGELSRLAEADLACAAKILGK
jgi:polysaccharide pyruvyl transferase CsaB